MTESQRADNTWHKILQPGELDEGRVPTGAQGPPARRRVTGPQDSSNYRVRTKIGGPVVSIRSNPRC